MNPYADILKDNLPKLLSLYDMDESSPTYGFGDRLHWGWKVSDFSNATLQGGVHSLAAAIQLGLVENKEYVLNVINAAILAIPKITSAKGAVQEAYPNEHSFCVSALVAFDTLSAIEILDKEINQTQRERYFSAIRPLIDFISNNDEEHAIISNHLATGVAAIVLWNKLTGSSNKRHESLLEIIYKHQSSEGWYLEYEGPDIGYQTLCTYYLGAAYEASEDPKLKESLVRSFDFLRFFVHPDGTLGGLHGSRNTEVYYPGGYIALAQLSDNAAYVVKSMENGLEQNAHILPQQIDIGNYIPCLNSYAFAAMHYSKFELPETKPFYNSSQEKKFSEAGIFLKATDNYFAIVNYKKGGTIKVYNLENNTLDIEDGGFYGELQSGKVFTTQVMDESIDFKDQGIRARFYYKNTSTPSPLTFMVLRFLSLTIFRSLKLGNAFKRFVVKRLMTGKKALDGHVIREFVFENDSISVNERIQAPARLKKVSHIGKFKAIHMASSGYYLPQVQAMPETSKFVTFHEVGS